MIEFILNEFLYVVLMLLLLLTTKAIIKKPKPNWVIPVAVGIVSFHSLMYFTLLLVSSFSIWYPDLIRIKSTTIKSEIDLGFGSFIVNVIIIYLINLICLTLSLITLFRNRMKVK